MSFRGITVALVAAAVATLGLIAAPASGAIPPKGPKGKAFYATPSELPSGHGKVIWQRKAPQLVPLAEAARNKVVLYTSRSRGRRIGVSGSVHVPAGKPPRGGWPVISWAHGTTGIADACAPTRNRETSPAKPYIFYIDPQLNAYLRAGYAVVRTDFEGLGTPGIHPYLVGRSEGRSVVDMVRAARDVDRRIGKRFFIAGHSQGGHAALFAAGLAKRWAPELKLRGTIAYAPASHLLEQAQALAALTTPSPLTALAMLILAGASQASDSIDIPALVADEPLALYPKIDRTCLGQLATAENYGGIAPSDLLRDDADTTDLFRVLAKMNPAVSSSAPILIAQGTADTTVFPFFTDALNTELNELGNNVTYKKYEEVGHGLIVAEAEPDALAFLRSRTR